MRLSLCWHVGAGSSNPVSWLRMLTAMREYCSRYSQQADEDQEGQQPHKDCLVPPEDVAGLSAFLALFSQASSSLPSLPLPPSLSLPPSPSLSLPPLLPPSLPSWPLPSPPPSLPPLLPPSLLSYLLPSLPASLSPPSLPPLLPLPPSLAPPSLPPSLQPSIHSFALSLMYLCTLKHAC